MSLQNVSWTSLVNTSAGTTGGSSVEKISGDPGDTTDAGAISSQQISGNGYFEFVRPDTTGTLIAGLGTNSGTNYTDITHSFSFSAGLSSVEIREGGAYITEFAYAGGDTFKLDITGTTVKYYINGVLKYTSAASVTLPTKCDVSFATLNTPITTCKVETGVAGTISPPAGSLNLTGRLESVNNTGAGWNYPGVITDYTVRTPGATPSIAKGGKITDALFGREILRVTDGTTPNQANYSMRTPSAPNQMAWSAEGDRFYLIDDNGSPAYVWDFDPVNFTATFNRTVAWGIEAAFPRVTGKRHIMYGVRFIATHVIEKYDFTAAGGAGAFTTVLDLKTIDASLNDTVYTSSIYVSGGATERAVVNYGGTGQDYHMKVTVFDVNNPTTRRTIHTQNSTIDLHDGNGPQAIKDETNTTVTMNILTHSISISNDGNTVRIDPAGTASFHWLYDWTLNRFKKVTQFPWGHYVLGWGYEVNEDQGSGPKMQWQLRSLALANANSPTQRITSTNPQTIVHTEDHTSWHNADSAAKALIPFFSECQIAGGDPWSYWSNEIIAVQASGPEKVWRFCHHRCDAYFDDDIARTELGTFYYEPMLQVDPTGRYCLFSSNWDKTLGTHPSPPASNIAKRMDVFIVSLGTPTSSGTNTITPLTGALAITGRTATATVLGPAKPGAGALSFVGRTATVSSGTTGAGMVTITGSIYSAATGGKLVSGTLYLKPKGFIRLGNDLIAPKTVSYNIPGTGNISVAVAPSADDVVYAVEFDPNPADTSVPMKMKSGYFYDEWLVPGTGPVDIAAL